MVERDLAKVEVASSNLVSRSTKFEATWRLSAESSLQLFSIVCSPNYGFDIQTRSPEKLSLFDTSGGVAKW